MFVISITIENEVFLMYDIKILQGSFISNDIVSNLRVLETLKNLT